MGRKKLVMKPIENPTFRQVTYNKRKDGIFKKAHELSVLCDTDVGLILFSPNGRVHGFASKESRVEDIFLRYVGRPDELRAGPVDTEEGRTNLYLSQKLKQMKKETQMLEKIAVIEELEEKLEKLNKKKHEAQEKMRYYKPDVEKINSVLEAQVCEQYLSTALQHIHLSKAKLLGNEELAEMQVSMHGQGQGQAQPPMEGATSGHDAKSKGKKPMIYDEDHCRTSLSIGGPHLSLGFPDGQWTNNPGTSISNPSFPNFESQ